MTDDLKPASPAAPAAAATPATVPVRSGRPKAPRAAVLLIVVGVGGFASLMVIASTARSKTTPPPEESSPARPDDTIARSEPDTAHPVDATDTLSRPRWTATRISGRRQPPTVVFELTSDKPVAVWRKLVQPVLTVRCAGGKTEVFVLTHSAASIEPEPRHHTVTLRLDAGSELVQMWEHSIENDALFAPDARALAHQIAGAERMSFTFTPFNARPALVTFSVDGFGDQLQPAARRLCGW